MVQAYATVKMHTPYSCHQDQAILAVVHRPVQSDRPEEVLQNFRYAYIYRDSLVYSELFDTSFVFLYFDPDIGGAGGYDYWGRDTELRTTGRLFRAFDHFTLVWNATIATDTSQTGEISLTKTFDLSIGGEFFLSGNAVFDFVGDPAGTWRISRWQDESFF